jgi:hypothetical protein
LKKVEVINSQQLSSKYNDILMFDQTKKQSKTTKEKESTKTDDTDQQEEENNKAQQTNAVKKNQRLGKKDVEVS